MGFLYFVFCWLQGYFVNFFHVFSRAQSVFFGYFFAYGLTSQTDKIIFYGFSFFINPVCNDVDVDSKRAQVKVQVFYGNLIKGTFEAWSIPYCGVAKSLMVFIHLFFPLF